MTTQVNEDLRRMQKLSGILLEDGAFNAGRVNNGNHDDAYWAAIGKSGREADGVAADLLHDEDGSVVDRDNSLLVWTDESQNHLIAVSGVTTSEQLDAQLRDLVGDTVYSAYIDEPGVFAEVPGNEQINPNTYVEIMSVKEVARLLNRWAVRNGLGHNVKRLDKSNMRA